MYLFNLLAKKRKNTIYNNYKDTVCQNLLAFSTFIKDSDDPSVLPYFWNFVRISLNKVDYFLLLDMKSRTSNP